MEKWRKLVAVLFATAIAGAFTGSALSSPLHPKPKCNSGDGNGSEIVTTRIATPGTPATTTAATS